MITIGIPVYNAGRFIQKAIDSVLNQTFPNFELVITDDGSTDDTYEILESYKDKRIVIVRDGQNKGISYRLNQQIAMASGRFFARMDADDVMFPNRIEMQFSEFKKRDIDILYTDAVSINTSNEVIGYKISRAIHNQNDILAGIVPIHPTVMAKTEVFKSYQYNGAYTQMEDLELWYRIADRFKFGNLNAPLLFYREDSTPNSEKHKKMIKAKKQFADEYQLPLVLKQKTILSSMSKAFIYKIFEFWKMDNILLRRRYTPLQSHDIKRYQEILNLSSKSQ